MIEMFQLGIIAVTLSIDALGIGFSYRMRGVKITERAKLVVGMMTGSTMWLSMIAGKILAAFLPAKVMNIFGTVLLALIGLSMIRKSLFGEEAFYDFDKSKNIEIGEALVLGLALAADAASCGIALSAVTWSSFWLPVFTGITHAVFLWVGELLFEKGVKTRLSGQKGMGVVAGGLLVVMALLKM